MMLMATSAIADSSIISVFSSVGLCWIITSLFKEVLIAPSTEFRFALTDKFTSVEIMSTQELDRAVSLRSANIWNGSSTIEYTGYGLPPDAAECLAIAEERQLTVLSDSDAVHAYNALTGNLNVLNRGDVLEEAAQRGILEENYAAQMYNVEIPNRLSLGLKKRTKNGKTEIMRLFSNPPRQEWTSTGAPVSVTFVQPQGDDARSSGAKSVNPTDL